jgi:hypothetical protein
MPANLPLLARSPLDSIEERELDLLLLVAIHGSSAFRNALIEKITGETPAEFISAWRGVFNQHGETDVLLLVRMPDGDRLAIMIEHKIDAGFQDRQADRYRTRGRLGVAEGNWDRYLTCLCAPKAYAEPDIISASWDRIVFLEDVEQTLAATGDPFAPFLCAAMRHAVEKNKTGSFEPNPLTTEFWRQYAELCRQEYPDIMMSPLRPRQSTNDPWPRFAVGRLPSGVKLEHKPWLGRVDLTFQRYNFKQVSERLSGILPSGLTVASTPPSAAVRSPAPPLIATNPFDQQVEAVRASLKAVQRLIALWPDIRKRMGYEAPIREVVDAANAQAS